MGQKLSYWGIPDDAMGRKPGLTVEEIADVMNWEVSTVVQLLDAKYGPRSRFCFTFTVYAPDDSVVASDEVDGSWSDAIELAESYLGDAVKPHLGRLGAREVSCDSANWSAYYVDGSQITVRNY